MNLIGILCPGQGSQDQLTIDFAAGHPGAEAILQLAEVALGTSIPNVLAKDRARLYENSVAQPLICAVQLATWVALASQLPMNPVFAGYSVGELTAYACAGALVPAALIEIACRRARAMDVACQKPSRMTAVRGLSQAELLPLVRANHVHIAIVQDEDHFVIAGLASGMETFESAARTFGAGLTQLPIAIASHTPLMTSAAIQMRRYLEGAALVAPKSRVIAAIDGQPVISRERAIETLSAQTAAPVDWAACMEGLREAGCTAFLELGPGSDLAQMVRRKFPQLSARSVSDFRTVEGIVRWVQQI